MGLAGADKTKEHKNYFLAYLPLKPHVVLLAYIISVLFHVQCNNTSAVKVKEKCREIIDLRRLEREDKVERRNFMINSIF